MRTVLAWLVVGILGVVACGNEYGSDDPAVNPDGGTSDDDDDADGGNVPRVPITVTGKIVSFGVGMPNIPVVVGGKVAVNTSALGTFTVSDVMPPYDVSFALKTNDSQPRITVYRGLTRPDPTLIALGTSGELRPNATTAASLSGRVTGGGGPGWPGTPLVSFGAPNRAGGSVIVQQTGLFDLTGADAPLWYGATSVTGSLHASLVIDNATPTAFYGRRDGVALRGGESLSDQNVDLAPVPVGTLTATFTAPAKYRDPSKTVVNMGARYEELAGYFIKTTNPGAFPVTLTRLVPFVAGSSYQVNIGYGDSAESSFARVVRPASSKEAVTLALAEPPSPSEPADGATIERSAAFSFSAFPEGIHRITLVAANQPSITIVTMGTSVTLPDLAPFAVTLPSGVEYTWRIAGFRPIASVDSDQLPAMLAAIDGNLPNVDACAIALSPQRRVTLAP